jgi:hypothetical protein
VSVVHYEQLKSDPIGEIGRVLTASGLESPPELVSKIAAGTDIQRYPSGHGHFRYRGEAGSWVEHFGPDDERLFHTLVGDLFERAGYDY